MQQHQPRISRPITALLKSGLLVSYRHRHL